MLSLIANAIYKRLVDKKLIKSIVRELKCNTRLWVLLIAIIETNAILITFNCFLQLLSNGLF